MKALFAGSTGVRIEHLLNAFLLNCLEVSYNQVVRVRDDKNHLDEVNDSEYWVNYICERGEESFPVLIKISKHVK